MRKHIILFFSALLFLFACNGNKDAKGVLERGDMISLLVDVHMVDGMLSNLPNGDSLYHSGTGRYMLVFKQHHTDSAQFRKSMAYYVSQPDDFVKMYDEVIKTLQAKADSMNTVVARDNETTRKHLEELQKKKLTTEKDSAGNLIKQKAERNRLMMLDQKRRMELNKPIPKGFNTNPRLKNFQKGL